MNTYIKYTQNVFLAQCTQKHTKGGIIIVTTKRDKENESIVFNLIYEKDDFYYYSIVRADGFNVQKWAKRKSELYGEWALSAESKSDDYYKASNKDKNFLSLAEPIKIGHHSERGHRKIIDDAWRNMGKSYENTKKAEKHKDKSQYWAGRTEDINLSMPESIDYFEHKFQKSKEFHEGLKSGRYKRQHSYSLTYAKKEVNNLQKKYQLAKKLWE